MKDALEVPNQEKSQAEAQEQAFDVSVMLLVDNEAIWSIVQNIL